MSAEVSAPASSYLRCFGFAESARPLLKDIGAGRHLVFESEAPSQSAALLAKGKACADALSFAAEHGASIEAIVLISPDASTAQRAVEVGESCVAQTLALCGTLDAGGCANAVALKKTLAACHLVYVFDAGENVETERAEAVMKVAQDFIARREKFVVSNADGRLTP